MKYCSKCDTTKPVEEFGKWSQGKDGLKHYCKECCRADSRKYYDSNKEQVLKRNKEHYYSTLDYQRDRRRRYYENHSEENKAYARAWRAANPERAKANRRAHYLANREKTLEQNRQWSENNPERRKAINRGIAHRRRAAKGCAVPQRWVKSAETPGQCYWCGSDISDYYEVDHIMPLSKGGPDVDSNKVKACKGCNSQEGKGHKHPLVWIASLM